MKIPNTMPYLRSKNVLILVSGGSSAQIYKINNGSCELVDTITAKMLSLYHDLETKSVLDIDYKGHAKTINKPTRSITQERLVKLITKHLTPFIADEPESVYVFCPQKISLKLIRSIEKLGNASIEIARYGNYTKFHPNDLLKRIEQMINSRKLIIQ